MRFWSWLTLHRSGQQNKDWWTEITSRFVIAQRKTIFLTTKANIQGGNSFKLVSSVPSWWSGVSPLGVTEVSAVVCVKLDNLPPKTLPYSMNWWLDNIEVRATKRNRIFQEQSESSPEHSSTEIVIMANEDQCSSFWWVHCSIFYYPSRMRWWHCSHTEVLQSSTCTFASQRHVLAGTIVFMWMFLWTECQCPPPFTEEQRNKNGQVMLVLVSKNLPLKGDTDSLSGLSKQ